jgi:hypothetical protein
VLQRLTRVAFAGRATRQAAGLWQWSPRSPLVPPYAGRGPVTPPTIASTAQATGRTGSTTESQRRGGGGGDGGGGCGCDEGCDEGCDDAPVGRAGGDGARGVAGAATRPPAGAAVGVAVAKTLAPAPDGPGPTLAAGAPGNSRAVPPARTAWGATVSPGNDGRWRRPVAEPATTVAVAAITARAPKAIARHGRDRGSALVVVLLVASSWEPPDRQPGPTKPTRRYKVTVWKAPAADHGPSGSFAGTHSD